MFARAKELSVSIIPYLAGHNLPGALRIESTAAQEQAFAQRHADISAEAINGSLPNVMEDQARYLDFLFIIKPMNVFAMSMSCDDFVFTLFTAIGRRSFNAIDKKQFFIVGC